MRSSQLSYLRGGAVVIHCALFPFRSNPTFNRRRITRGHQSIQENTIMETVNQGEGVIETPTAGLAIPTSEVETLTEGVAMAEAPVETTEDLSGSAPAES
jgi:hypothetical protein